MITELVISGGGVKGYGYLGAITELQNLKLLNSLKTISCVSVGAIFGITLALGYNYNKFQEFLFKCDVSKIKDIDIYNFIKRKSLLKGDEYYKYVKDILSFEEIDSSNMTLLELYEKSKIRVIIAVSCINSLSIEYIDYMSHPDLTLYNVILMSSAIPMILPPIIYNNRYYMDGAILDNTPTSKVGIDACIIREYNNGQNLEYNIKNIFDLIFGIFLMIYKVVNISSIKNPKKCINIEVGNVKVISFDISLDNKLTMIHSGKSSVKNSLYIKELLGKQHL